MFTYVASSTFVFQDGYGMTAQQFGWVFAGGAVAITVARRSTVRWSAGSRPSRCSAARSWSVSGLSLSLFATTIADGPLWLVVTLLVLTLGTAGFVLPSAPAIALANNPHRAGSAAALLGALQFGLGALIAPLTSIGGTPTAESMAGVMAGTILISALLLLAVRRSWSRIPTTAAIEVNDTLGSVGTDSRVPGLGPLACRRARRGALPRVILHSRVTNGVAQVTSGDITWQEARDEGRSVTLVLFVFLFFVPALIFRLAWGLIATPDEPPRWQRAARRPAGARRRAPAP